MDYYKIVPTLESVKKYQRYDLFCYTNGKYVKFKAKETSLEEVNISSILHDDLYIRMVDRVDAIKNKQRELNKELTQSIKIDLPKAKAALQNIVNNMLDEPKTPVLKEARSTINIIVNEYLANPKVIESLTFVALHDYSTSLHLTNCMLLCLGYAHFNKLSKNDMTLLGMMGLMHDVGKVEIPDYILQASRKLTDEEFELIKNHPIDSRRLLVEANFEPAVIKAAHEHHERLDGSGYPKGKKDNEITEYAKILSIIDVYEALTHWRPYKDRKTPLEALKIIKQDVDNNKFSRDHFVSFSKSIVGTNKI